MASMETDHQERRKKLCQLHNQGQDQFVYNCNYCKANVETRFHCTVCDDFYLCIKCHNTIGHVHKMQRLGFELGDDSAGGHQKQINPQESRTLAIQCCIAQLEHACQCRGVNCPLQCCQKMKKIVSHAKTCMRKGNGICLICKQLIALCCSHAKYCQETECPMPFCLNIKHKLKQQRMEKAQILKRRIATMQNRGMTETIKQTSPGSSNLSTQPSPDTNHIILQPGIGMKLSACPPVGALQAIQQVQHAIPNPNGSAPGAKKIPQGMSNPGTSASSAMQQKTKTEQVLQQLVTSLKSPNFSQQKRQQVMHVLKGNPRLMAIFIKLISVYRQQNIQPHQPLGSRPQSQMMRATPNLSVSAPMEVSQDVSNPGTSTSSATQQRSNAQVLQQLLMSLKSSNFPLQKKQQVLQLLKATIIKLKHRLGQPRQ